MWHCLAQWFTAPARAPGCTSVELPQAGRLCLQLIQRRVLQVLARGLVIRDRGVAIDLFEAQALADAAAVVDHRGCIPCRAVVVARGDVPEVPRRGWELREGDSRVAADNVEAGLAGLRDTGLDRSARGP